jgi:cyclase
MPRRVWAWASAGAALIAALPADAREAEADFSLAEVRPGVFAAIAQPGRDATIGNSGFIVGSDAVLVVDSFATGTAAERLLIAIRRKTSLPIRWLVNTHHHLDHCGGNGVFAKAGAVIVAHENARSRMRDAALVRMARVPPPEREKFLRFSLPSETFRDAVSIWLGDRRVDVFSKPGHTDGDSLVSVPDADVLFGGDLFQKATVPNLADADSQAWVRTLDDLARRFPTATLIPGHGGVARPLDMRSLREYLVVLRLAVAEALQQGKAGATLSEEVVPMLSSRYRSWNWADHIADSVAQMEEELTGKTASVPAPTP